MTEKLIPSEQKKGKVQPPQNKPADKKPVEGPGPDNPLAGLQQQVGNQAVQRLIAQRQSGPAETDEATADQINQLRGGGQSLDGNVQRELGQQMGADFSGVSVHATPEADDLNKRLGARAFTTGQDIFFRQGEYSPGSQSGKELLAHELTHVVQQREGVSGSPAAKMAVNPPDDAYEQEADQVAKQVTGPAAVQAQVEEEEEEEELAQPKAIQRQEEEELLQGKLLQRQVEEQEEEEVQMKPIQRQEEEELAMPKMLQRQVEEPEEEEVQMKSIQRQEEEELAMPKMLQRQEMPEEEMQMKADGRADHPLETG